DPCVRDPYCRSTQASSGCHPRHILAIASARARCPVAYRVAHEMAAVLASSCTPRGCLGPGRHVPPNARARDRATIWRARPGSAQAKSFAAAPLDRSAWLHGGSSLLDRPRRWLREFRYELARTPPRARAPGRWRAHVRAMHRRDGARAASVRALSDARSCRYSMWRCAPHLLLRHKSAATTALQPDVARCGLAVLVSALHRKCVRLSCEERVRRNRWTPLECEMPARGTYLPGWHRHLDCFRAAGQNCAAVRTW